MKHPNKSSRKQRKPNGKLRALALLALLLVVGLVVWRTSKPILAARTAASSLAAAVESSRLSLDTAVETFRNSRTDANWQAVEAARQVYETAFTEAVEVNAVSANPVMAASAALQLQTLSAMKKSLTPNQKKIGSRLLFVARKQRGQLPVELRSMRTSVPTNAAGAVKVNLTVINRTAGLKVLDKFGFKVINATGKLIVAEVPLNRLEDLAAAPEILAIREYQKPHTNRMEPLTGEAKRAGKPGFEKRMEALRNRLRASLAALVANVSEGDQTHRAQEARGFFGVNGTGVKIGVISDSVDHLALSQGSGDLGPVTVLPGQDGVGLCGGPCSGEGTAMLEIVHDLAPGAQLYFATALPDQAQFAQNIRDLAAAGCQIIVDDIIYLDESPVHDGQPALLPSTMGIIAQAVNDVTAAGTLYFSSAGNEGNSTDLTSGTWEGNFLASAAPDPGPLAGANLHDFGDGGNSILVEFGAVCSGGCGTPVLLHWADPLTMSANDYDIYDMNGTLTTIFDASTDVQDGDDEPIEAIVDGAETGERLLIDKFADDGNAANGTNEFLSLRIFRGEFDDTLATTGSIYGHSAAANAFSVGATPADASFDGITPDGPFPGPHTAANESESFTSDGPRRMLFNASNTAITPGNVTSTGGLLRQKPDITAADGVMTATPGFNPFYGTSASAPHAAAIAALLLSANPALTPAQVRTALVSSAIDIETAGTDRDTGAGIVMAFQALQAIGATPQAYLGLGTVTLTETAGDNDGFAEPCERLNYTIGLTNVGGVPATAISATLTSSTPGVVINQGVSAYPDLVPTASANNITPFNVTLPCTLACASTVNFTLTVTYSGGSSSPQSFNFSTVLGGSGAPMTFSYTGPAVPIPDGADLSGTAPGAPVNANLAVAGLPGPVADIDFRFDGTACSATAGSTTVGLDHTFVNDLQITLRAPSGQTVLVINNTDGSGNNFCQTLLNDESAGPSIQSVATANAPFTGSFKPNAPLAGLDGVTANGTWQLQAQDFYSADTGNIRAFSLIITPADCTTAACTLSQSNITVPLTPPATTAVVNYNPSITGGCGIVTCVPPSGSTFNLGVTPVTCTPQSGSPLTFTVTVTCPALTLAPTLPNGVQGTAYNQSVVATGGAGYTYAVTTNILPPGLTLNAATGAITGTPSAAGNYTFVVTATGPAGCTKTQTYNVLITGTCTTITVNPTTLPNGTLGTAYPLTTVSAAGGVAPYTFAVTQGALPAGLALNGTTGEITGTPTAAGTLSFRVTATGQGGCTGSRVYVVSVACATLTFNPPSLPNGAKGVAYNQPITITPGTGHTFSVLLGSLPPGFTLSAAGVLSGLTNQAGTWTFTVKAVLGSCQATKQYTLTIPAPAAPTALAQLNDYDGDAKSDLALFAANGEWRIQRSSDQKSQTVLWGTAGDLPVSGDYDGDGRTDVAVFRPSDGTWYVKRSSDGAALIKAWGLKTDVPVPGDYDGDGRTDIAIWRGGEGNWYILRSSDQQFEMANWGLGLAPFNDVPVAGDYDGDGKTDIGVFRRGSGVWYVRQSSNGNFLIKQWGVGSDVPVVQDYDGDGKVDLAVWRGATGLWYVQESATGATRSQAWGAGFAPYNDQAVPGDYDGDRQADLAVWRAADATWYVLQSNNGSMLTKTQGQSGDAPVVQRMR